MTYLGDIIKQAHLHNRRVKIILPDEHTIKDFKLRTKDGEVIPLKAKSVISFKGLQIYNYIDRIMAYASHPCQVKKLYLESHKGEIVEVEVLPK